MVSECPRFGISRISVTPGFRRWRLNDALAIAHGTVLSFSPEMMRRGPRTGLVVSTLAPVQGFRLAVAAWNSGDLDAFMKTYWNSPKTVFAGSSGVFKGWKAVLGRYKRTYPDRAAMGHTTFTALEITELAPDAALATGHWHLKRANGDLGGVFTLVLDLYRRERVSAATS